MTLIGCTVSGNVCRDSPGGNYGGGLGNNGAFMRLINSTVTNNASMGTFVSAAGIVGYLTMRNSIVAGNYAGTVPSDIQGSVTSEGCNLIGTNANTTITPSTGDQIGTATAPLDPKLSPLLDFDGPTPTHALLAGSPAIDAGRDLTTVGPGGVNDSTTTVPVADGSCFAGGMVIRIGSEEMLVTAVTGNWLTVTRGANGTTAAAHADGAAINPAFDQRGAGFARVVKGKAASAAAAVDIGAHEAAPQTLHVNAAVSGGNDSGDSWTNAMPELRTALASRDPNVTQIWVARGTYRPAAANGDREATFRLRSGLAIYGGFTRGQANLADRDKNPATNDTVLSGDLNGDDSGFTNNGENSHHVVTGSGADATAVLEGFTITAGNAGASCGGGVSIDNGSPTLDNLIVDGNTARLGGGIYTLASRATLTNARFSRNTAEAGGGLYESASSLTLTNAVFSGNSAQFGGAIQTTASDSTCSNVTISGNTGSLGAAIYGYDSILTIRNSILWGDKGTEIVFGGGYALVSNSIVQGSGGSMNWDGHLGVDGGGNLDVDPLFVTPIDLNATPAPTTAGNLRLRSTSPAVNAGDNNVAKPALPATDFDGNPRIVGGTVDLGAFETTSMGELARTAQSAPALNRSTGLIEWMVRITNNTGGPIEGVRLTVTNLPPSCQLWNRTHPTLPIIEVQRALAAGATVDVKLAIYSTGRSLGTWVPVYTATPLTATTLTPETHTMPSAAGNYDITVASGGVWSVTESLAWASVSTLDGNGTGTVTVTLQPNPSVAARTGTIKIGLRTHTIKQFGVVRPVLSAMSASYPAIVSGAFSLAVPTTNLPVSSYTVTGLPPGLAINQASGIISGKPTRGGTYNMTVKASNAAGTSNTVAFVINVAALPEGVVGTFHGFVDRSPDVYVSSNALVGARFQMTTTPSGGVSGSIIEGATTRSFTGSLTATVANPNEPELQVSVLSTALTLALEFDATTNSVAGTLNHVAAGKSTPVRAWRNGWKTTAPARLATVFKGLHTFAIENADASGPQGFGHGSFTVTGSTGALTIAGRLPDGTAITGSTFIGQGGEVLICQPLYANRGSCLGYLSVDPKSAPVADNEIAGDLTWFKPATLAATADTVYRAGFGPVALVVEGGAYTPPAAGLRVMNLPAVSAPSNNAELDFSMGGLGGAFF